MAVILFYTSTPCLGKVIISCIEVNKSRIISQKKKKKKKKISLAHQWVKDLYARF